MRFVCGPIPESSGLDAEANGWTPLREPDSRRFAFVAILLSVPFQVAAIWILFSSLESFRTRFKSGPLGVLLFVAPLLLLIPLHEFVHALAYLKGLRSRRLIMGIWPRRGMAYVIYDSPMRRNRLLFMVTVGRRDFLQKTPGGKSLLFLLPGEQGINLPLQLLLLFSAHPSSASVNVPDSPVRD